MNERLHHAGRPCDQCDTGVAVVDHYGQPNQPQGLCVPCYDTMRAEPVEHRLRSRGPSREEVDAAIASIQTVVRNGVTS